MASQKFHISALAPMVLCATALFVGCQSTPEAPRGMQTYSDAIQAYATMEPTSIGTVAGQLQIQPFGEGIRITGELHGFPHEGAFAFHVREVGDCSNDGRSAGRIFNPFDNLHGRYARGEHMLGDMDNLDVGPSRSVRINRSLQGVTLGGGQYNDVANLSLAVHEYADDYQTQPDGNAGRPLSCGVIEVTNPPPRD